MLIRYILIACKYIILKLCVNTCRCFFGTRIPHKLFPIQIPSG